MPKTPAERLTARLEHVRRGWTLVQQNPAYREHARHWLETHPSNWREVDELWEKCLRGEGPLAEWLATGADPGAWHAFPALHSVLAGHPFPDLHSWLIQRMSRAS